MVSRHTSPSYTNGKREPIIDANPMGIPKNSSPILDPHKTTDVSTKSSPIAVVADGEVVVFDDNDDWKGDCLFSFFNKLKKYSLNQFKRYLNKYPIL